MGSLSMSPRRLSSARCRTATVAAGGAALAVGLGLGLWVGSARQPGVDGLLTTGHLTDLSANAAKACLLPDGGRDAQRICGLLVVAPGISRPQQGDRLNVFVRSTPDGTLLVVHATSAPS